MSDRVEEQFSRLRRGPWYSDAMAVPQEGFGGNGNVESSGWLSDGSVTADVLQANSVIAGKIAAGTVTATEIAANTITAGQIAAATITSNELAANSVTANQLAANSVVAGDLQAGAVVAGNIAADVVTATEIAALTITASELAADSVITSKILAGNVVSSKIELVVSGKSFGTNSGSVTAPGVFFDADVDTGLYFESSAFKFAHNGAVKLSLLTGGVSSASQVFPTTDNAVSLGAATNRWTEVFAVNGTINTSDERLKMDVADEQLGLDFVRRLQPRVYRWRSTPDTQARRAAVVDQAALDRECQPHEQAIRRIRDRQLAGTISDADAEEQVGAARAALDEIRQRYLGPAQAVEHAMRPGRRLHHGLVAQEVKGALDALGVDPQDAAFWQNDPDGGQGLSYSELMAPVIRAVQELAAENAEQAARIAALERA